MVAGTPALAVGGSILVLGLAYAAVQDWKSREVSDRTWQFMAVGGVALGVYSIGAASALALGLWILAGALVLEHLFPWETIVERRSSNLAGMVELAAYGATLTIVIGVALRYGVGPSTVPVPVIAVVATVLIARGLFEAGILYGGADAKALIVAGALIPLDPAPVAAVPAAAAGVLSLYPFALNLLMNAALLSIAVPVALAVRNVRSREFEFPRGFTGYRIPVAELPTRFVWLRDPTFGRGEDDEAETAAEDRVVRERQRDELTRQGVTRVWVTPQLPFVVLLFGGAVVALLAGNLFFDLAALV